MTDTVLLAIDGPRATITLNDPAKHNRLDTVGLGKLREAIEKVEADLEKARSAGDEKKIAELEENLASRRSFLEMAERASADYS